MQGHKIPVSSVQKPDRRDYRLASNESTHTHNKTKQLKHAHNSRNRSHYFCLEGNLLEQKAIEKGFRQFDLEPEHYICIYGGIRILYIYIYTTYNI